VPVRLFLTQSLLSSAEDNLYRQIVNAPRFPGVKLVVITPDVHYGYGVLVGCVILTDADSGAVAMGPVGYDIGCGMMSARSTVSADRATPEKKLKFNRAVMGRVQMGYGGKSERLGQVTENEFNNLVRGGAEYYAEKYGASFDRSRAERHRIPVDDDWDIPSAAKADRNVVWASSAVWPAAGILVNLDGHVPLDEAAPAYKSSEEVLRAVTDAGLATVEHKLWPLASLKGVDERRRDRKRKTKRDKSSEHY